MVSVLHLYPFYQPHTIPEGRTDPGIIFSTSPSIILITSPGGRTTPEIGFITKSPPIVETSSLGGRTTPGTGFSTASQPFVETTVSSGLSHHLFKLRPGGRATPGMGFSTTSPIVETTGPGGRNPSGIIENTTMICTNDKPTNESLNLYC